MGNAGIDGAPEFGNFGAGGGTELGKEGAGGALELGNGGPVEHQNSAMGVHSKEYEKVTLC